MCTIMMAARKSFPIRFCYLHRQAPVQLPPLPALVQLPPLPALVQLPPLPALVQSFVVQNSSGGKYGSF
ncbi:hypothetical protein Y032_0219g2459 [Ancylostoma ceylanicum]|uniref:Uncharacterized protein n=1 Tax=Ancylostoma ceylanicum TaxID=53326 RepID=A0A016SIN1_9BILA|nr:hypothetical protein Y032_0219g2459 [Ancylostoma ceylanicum]